MEHMQKIAIAAAFEQQHNMEIYAELRQLRAIDIYDNLVNGKYGEVREILKGRFEVEIKASESCTGYSVVFNFGVAGHGAEGVGTTELKR